MMLCNEVWDRELGPHSLRVDMFKDDLNVHRFYWSEWNKQFVVYLPPEK